MRKKYIALAKRLQKEHSMQTVPYEDAQEYVADLEEKAISDVPGTFWKITRDEWYAAQD